MMKCTRRQGLNAVAALGLLLALAGCAGEPAGTPLVLAPLDIMDSGERMLAKVTGDKVRAKRQLVRLLDPEASGPNQVSLNLILDLLTALTGRIRSHVTAPEYAIWQRRWAPVVVALGSLLARVQPAVLEESRTLRVELPRRA